jgi:hypothetical protein
MPFSPSDFEWWAWMLFAIGGAIVCGILGIIASAFSDSDHPLGPIAILVFAASALIAGLGSLGCFLLAIVRFAKWAWGG